MIYQKKVVCEHEVIDDMSKIKIGVERCLCDLRFEWIEMYKIIDIFMILCDVSLCIMIDQEI